jgi:hypothetical protein
MPVPRAEQTLYHITGERRDAPPTTTSTRHARPLMTDAELAHREASGKS